MALTNNFDPLMTAKQQTSSYITYGILIHFPASWIKPYLFKVIDGMESDILDLLSV